MKKYIATCLLLTLLTACGSPEKDATTGKTATENGSVANDASKGANQSGQTQQGANSPNKTVVPANVKQIKVEIKDESTKDAKLAAFMKELNTVVQTKKKDKLLAMIDPALKTAAGAEGGKASFQTEWSLDKQSEKSSIWFVLAELLPLGGKLEGAGQYVIPNLTYPDFPATTAFAEPSDPAYSYTAVTGDHVNLREKPDGKGKVITQLSREVVLAAAALDKPVLRLENHDYRWRPVMTLDGKKGYMIEKYLRSSNDYRMTIKQTSNGEWKIASLAKGE